MKKLKNMGESIANDMGVRRLGRDICNGNVNQNYMKIFGNMKTEELVAILVDSGFGATEVKQLALACGIDERSEYVNAALYPVQQDKAHISNKLGGAKGFTTIVDFMLHQSKQNDLARGAVTMGRGSGIHGGIGEVGIVTSLETEMLSSARKGILRQIGQKYREQKAFEKFQNRDFGVGVR
jgi:hypothetical protein